MTAADGLWRAVDRLVDRASLEDLHSHRLHLLAARRWRELGKPIPPWLTRAEVTATVHTLALPTLMDHVRAAYSGSMVVMKGPAIAALYPDFSFRPFNDVDLLVLDSATVQKALLAYGFVPVGDPEKYVGSHQLRPLQLPGTPLAVEVHHEPKWLQGHDPPSTHELIKVAVQSETAEGFLVLPRPHHAVVAAVHSWAHSPLRRLLELIDVLLLSDGQRESASTLAQRWGVGRVWRTTIAAAEAAIFDKEAAWALRLWAQHLLHVRERTVLEHHLERWLSGFWALPFDRAVGSMLAAAYRDLTPAPGEPWDAKRRRVRSALRNAHLRRRAHERELDKKDNH